MLLMTLDHNDRGQRITEWMQEFHEMTMAIQAASWFLSPEDGKFITDFSMTIHPYIPSVVPEKPDMTPSEVDAISGELLLQQARVNELLRQRLTAMLSMHE